MLAACLDDGTPRADALCLLLVLNTPLGGMVVGEESL
jgi:hypothetical protein